MQTFTLDYGQNFQFLENHQRVIIGLHNSAIRQHQVFWMISITRGCKAARFVKGFLIYWLALALHAQPRLSLPDWGELTLELSPALMVKADLKAAEADQAKSQLVERLGTLQPPLQSAIYHLTVETRLKWFLSSKTWLGQLWIQPDLIALQRTRLKTGPSSNYKIYRYADGGVYRIRHQPKDSDQALQPPQTWPIASEMFHAFPDRGCAFISDPYAILLLLSQDWPVTETVICMFNKEGVYQVSFQRTGSQPVQADYRLKNSKSHRIQTLIQAERILIHPVPPEAGAGSDAEPFEFLGMEGDIVFLRDPTTRLPLQIEGEVPGFGQARLQLTQVKLRQP